MGDPALLDRITLRPTVQGLREPGLSIINWRTRPDLQKLKADEQFVDSTFHGHPALMFEGRWRGNWAERIVWKDQDWFDLAMSIPIQEDMQHSVWWPYIESFHYDPNWPSTSPPNQRRLSSRRSSRRQIRRGDETHLAPHHESVRAWNTAAT